MIGADVFLFFLGLIWVATATIFDLWKREVPNWLNFSLILFALAFRYFYSVFLGDFTYFLFGLMGFAFFFLLAHAFYYGRVFAGGDAKLLMGLGAVLPLFSDAIMNLKMLLYFVFIFMIAGSLYGLMYSFFLVVSHLRRFSREFASQFVKRRSFFYISLVFVFFSGIFAFYAQGIAWLLPGILLLLPFLYVYAKSVEEACLVNAVSPGKVTEGDWLYEKVRIGNKIILPRWEGLTKRQVDFIQKNAKRRVLIKQGIPFLPAFLIAYIFFFWKFVF